MRAVFTIFFISFIFQASFGQKDSTLKVTFLRALATGIKDFTTDNLGNIYLLTATDQIKKVNEKGDSIAVYNNIKRYGKVFSIDASNPLKVLVYFKDFSTIIILDRLMNVRNTIELRKQNILQVRAITSSYDNNIWLYDDLDSKIKKIDDNGRILMESNDFRQVFETVPSPAAMYDRDGQLYLYDPKKGLLVFDYYGAHKNNFALNQLMDLQVIDKNTITARDSTHIILFKPASLQLLSFNAFKEQKLFSKTHFNANRIFCLTEDGQLLIYTRPER